MSFICTLNRKLGSTVALVAFLAYVAHQILAEEDTCQVHDVTNGRVRQLNEDYFSYARYTDFHEDRVESGMSLYVTCDWHYSLSPEANTYDGYRKITCVQGTWDSEPKCKPKSCTQTPSQLTHGLTQYDGLEHGSRIRYSCDPGYTLSAHQNRTCNFGRWTGHRPWCIKNYCPHPKDLPEGMALIDGEKSRYDHNAVLRLNCSNGYRPPVDAVSRELTCYNTTWKVSGDLQCENYTCQVHDVTNGRVRQLNEDYYSYARYTDFHEDRVESGMSLYVTCDWHYSLSPEANTYDGYRKITCVQGTWDSEPKCKPKSCTQTPSQLTHGLTQYDGLEHGSRIRYSCDPGYTLSAHQNRTCNFGRWTGHRPWCIKNYCPHPKDLPEGMALIDGEKSRYDHNAVLRLNCSNGYRPPVDAVSRELTCYNTTWKVSGDLQCEKYTCQVHDVTNGRVRQLNEDYYSYARYTDFHEDRVESGMSLYVTCDWHYSLSPEANTYDGYRKITCVQGTWDSEPKCKPKSCTQTPSQLTHGLTQYDGLEHGSRIRHSCDPGYTLSTYQNRICNFGRWTGHKPWCIKNYCPHPKDLPEGMALKDDEKSRYDHNAVLRLKCSIGYTPSVDRAVRELTCYNTTWKVSGALQCERVPCFYEPTKHEVVISQTDTLDGKFHNSDLEIKCKRPKNFRLKDGVSKATCQHGEWKPSVPGCEPKSCGLLPSVPNGRIIYSDDDTVRMTKVVPHRDEAELECDMGYRVANDNRPFCVYGRWRGQKSMACDPAPPCPGYDDLGRAVSNPVPDGESRRVVCPRGYHLDQLSVDGEFLYLRNTTAKCSFGGWQPIVPECKPDPCKLPSLKNVDMCYENGTCGVDIIILHDTSVTFSCVQGYLWENATTDVTDMRLSCQSGQLVGTLPPKCIPDYRCTIPEEDKLIRSVYRDADGSSLAASVGDSVREGSVMVSRCERFNDMYFTGDPKRECKLGQWIGVEPNCTYIDINEGTHSHRFYQETSVPGQGISISDEGHLEVRKGSTFSLHCHFGEELDWSSVNGLNSAEMVRKLVHYVNLEWAKTVSSVLTIIHADELHSGTYFCRRKGDSVQTATFTVKVFVPCAKPRSTKDRSYSPVKELYLYNETVTFWCAYPKELAGSAILTCTEDGHWDSMEPYCKVPQCPELRWPENGRVVKNSRQVGETVSFECNAGFTVSGSQKRTCQGDKTWDGETTSCVEPCPGYDDRGRAVSYPVPDGESRRVVCPRGYHVDQLSVDGEFLYLRNTTAKCSLGEWQPIVPECKPDPCKLPSLENVDMCYENGTCGIDVIVLHDTNVTFSCVQGYMWENETTDVTDMSVSCQSGQLVGILPPKCIPDGTGCLDPGDFQNANRTGARTTNYGYYPSGEMLAYECHKGFLADGISRNQEIFCLGNGTWSDVLYNCTALTCDKPQSTKDRSYSPVKELYLYNETVTFSCEHPKVIAGSAVLTCGEDGQWDSWEPDCKVPQCPELRWPENGRVVRNSQQVGETVSFECNAGFIVSGSQKRTCQADKTWDGETTSCDAEIDKCIIPEEGKFVRSVYRDADGSSITASAGDRVREGSVMVSRCERFNDMYFTGDPKRVCKRGQWIGVEPKCEYVKISEGTHSRRFYYEVSKPYRGISISDEGHLEIRKGSTVTLTCQFGEEQDWSSINGLHSADMVREPVSYYGIRGEKIVSSKLAITDADEHHSDTYFCRRKSGSIPTATFTIKVI